MSWFSGKKFRRTRCENLHELVKSPNANEQMIQFLTDSPPILSFKRLDDISFSFTLQAEDKYFSFVFNLGEEHEMEKRDGSKVIIIYEMLSDNVMKQTIRMPDGKAAYFTREFSETETKMTVQFEGSETTGTIYYELVE